MVNSLIDPFWLTTKYAFPFKELIKDYPTMGTFPLEHSQLSMGDMRSFISFCEAIKNGGPLP